MKKVSILFLSVFIFLSYSLCDAITIAPIPVELTSQKVVVFSLEPTDDSERGKIFEVKVYKWDVATNEYVETSDLLVYPKASRLPAKFKIAIKANLNRDKEHTYRIVVSDISKEKEGINFKMSYDVPVFIYPNKNTRHVDVSCGPDTVKVHNTGNVTVKVSEMDGNGVVVYIPPGGIQEFKAKNIKVDDKYYCKGGN